MDDTRRGGQVPSKPSEVFAPVASLVDQARAAVEAHQLDVAVQALDSVESALPALRAYVAVAA